MRILKEYESWLIFLGSLALFLYGLFNRELVGQEVIFKLFTQEMLHVGPKIFPTLYGTPYTPLPGTLSFLGYLFSWSSGTATTLTLILPCALACTFSLVLLYKIAIPIHQEWARISVLLALFTFQFFDAARSLSIAPFLMLSNIWCFYQCIQNAPKKYLALPLVLGFLFQGPLGLLIAASGGWAFYLGQGNWLQLKKCLQYNAGLLLILSSLLALVATYQHGAHFAYRLFQAQIITPIATAKVWRSPAGLLIDYAVCAPLALISLLLLYKKTALNKILRSLFFWLMMNFFVLSLMTTQHTLDRLLPIAPVLALLAGSLWINPTSLAKKMILVFQLFCLALPFISLCLTIATLVTLQLKNLTVNAHYFSAFCTLSLFALVSVFIFCNHPIRYSQTHAKTVIAIGLASFLATMIFIVKPIEISLQQSKTFTIQVMMALHPNQPIYFLQLNPNQAPLLFFAALPQDSPPPPTQFISTITIPSTKPILYVTSKKIFDTLPESTKQKLTIIQTGQLGYHPMVAFVVQ